MIQIDKVVELLENVEPILKRMIEKDSVFSLRYMHSNITQALNALRQEQILISCPGKSNMLN